MDIGINFYSYLGKEKISNEKRCDILSSCGFKYTFCMSDSSFASPEGVKMLEKYGLKFDNLHAPFKDTNSIWKDSLCGEEIAQRLLCGVDKCHELGVGILVVHLTNAGPTPHLSDIGYSRFDRLYERANQKNVTIAYENIGSMKVLENIFIRQPDAKFCYDTGHEHCFSFFKKYMPKFGSRLVTTHIQDNRCLPFLDDHRLPYDGRIDFLKVAKQIAKENYTATLMFEVISSKSRMYKAMTAKEYYKKAAEGARKLAETIQQYKNI